MSKTRVHLIILWFTTVLWMLPRFARQDSLLGFSFQFLTTQTMGDAGDYIQLVEYFRGLAPPPNAPILFRQMAPWIASQLPFSPIVALTMVGVFGTLLTTTAMYAICRKVTADDDISFWATLFHTLSFGNFYYGPVGTVDSLTLGLCAAAMYFVIIHAYATALAFTFLAMLSKEVGLYLPFFTFAFLYQTRGLSRTTFLVSAVSAVVVVLAWWVSRKVLPPPGMPLYTWVPDWEIAVGNALRGRTWIALIMSFGIQGVVAAYWWARTFRNDVAWFIDPWKWGFAITFAFSAFNFVTGRTDGRFLWQSQLLTSVVLAVALMQLKHEIPIVARMLNWRPRMGASTRNQ